VCLIQKPINIIIPPVNAAVVMRSERSRLCVLSCLWSDFWKPRVHRYLLQNRPYSYPMQSAFSQWSQCCAVSASSQRTPKHVPMFSAYSVSGVPMQISDRQRC